MIVTQCFHILPRHGLSQYSTEILSSDETLLSHGLSAFFAHLSCEEQFSKQGRMAIERDKN